MGTEGNTFTSLLAMILNCPGDLGPIHRCIAQVYIIYVSLWKEVKVKGVQTNVIMY